MKYEKNKKKIQCRLQRSLKGWGKIWGKNQRIYCCGENMGKQKTVTFENQQITLYTSDLDRVSLPIRNNQKLKQKKLYPKNQMSLFNTELF